MNKDDFKPSLKIIGGTIVLAIVYGIAHDMVTAHVYVEYFSKYHPHIIDSQSPVAMALLWGVIATWWMGLFIGCGIAMTARLGNSPKLSAGKVLFRLGKGMAAVYVVAMLVLWFCLKNISGVYPIPGFQIHPRFSAVLVTHNVSYILSAVVAIGIGIRNGIERQKYLPPVKRT